MLSDTFIQISEKKIQIWLNSGKNNGHITRRPKYVSYLLAALNRLKSALCDLVASGC